MAKVLIVDDSRLSTSALSNMLQEMGHQILDTAFSGEEGLQKAKAINPEVVCLDMVMPGIDGAETAEKLQAQNRGVKIIMITQKELDVETKGRIKALTYIVKPITRAKLEDGFSNL
ncbi:MAG: response regulator transcription factor [Candidatus Kariarchaeaceae archaeon]|jgi:two-component SAPR family response regulator